MPETNQNSEEIRLNIGQWLASKNKEDKSNKVTSISAASTDTQYPSAKCMYDELKNKADVDDIPTKTSALANDGDGSNPFITQHQDISGKEDKSNKVSKWSTTPTNNNFPSEKLVKDSLNDKADSSSLATVATTGDYDDLSNTPTIPTVVDTVQDNNNNVVTSNAVYDALELKANAGHTHSTSEVLDPVAHPNIGTAANATQSTINMAVDNTIQSLLHVDMIVPVETKPTPNESTMNKLYLVPETDPQTDDEYQVWCTIRSGTDGNYQYAWKKLDPVRLDLSGYVRKSDVSLAIENDEIVLNLG